MAVRAGDAEVPLAMSESGRVSVVEGFWGMEGWTPSTASQWAGVVSIEMRWLVAVEHTSEGDVSRHLR